MNISINICTFNRGRHLDATLNSLRTVRIPEGSSVELLVIDNGSTDDTASVARSPRNLSFDVSYIRESRRGKGYAYNRALAEARGEILVFTDDDVRPSPQWLEKLCAPIRAGNADAVAGWIIIPGILQRPWMTSWHRAFLASTEDWDPSRIEVMNGANMAFSRRVLDTVPGFDPELGPGSLGFWDETLFSKQLVNAGFRLAGAPDGWVEHHFDADRLSRPAFLDRAQKEGRSHGYVAWHWEHERIPRPLLMVYRNTLRLLLARAFHKGASSMTEGCPEWEMNLLQKVAYYRQYAIERKRPRAYEKYGIRRLDLCVHTMSPSQTCVADAGDF